MNLRLAGKFVFVSGSRQGIGLAIAREFLEEGALVWINGRDAERLSIVHKALQKEFGDCVHAVVADASTDAGVKEIARAIKEKTTALDIIVATVGSGKAQKQDPLDPEEWERMYRINTLSTVRVMRELIPFMEGRKEAVIVIISSIAGRQQTRAHQGYAAAKEALFALVRNASVTLAPRGIRINAIVPGNIGFSGGRWEEILAAHPELIESYIKKEVPLQRLGTPEEVAAAAVFLASARASFITGTSLVVDGGEMRSY